MIIKISQPWLGGLRGYQMDDKMMSKPVLVRRGLGQGCAVVT